MDTTREQALQKEVSQLQYLLLAAVTVINGREMVYDPAGAHNMEILEEALGTDCHGLLYEPDAVPGQKLGKS